jgi:hypothetical protein
MRPRNVIRDESEDGRARMRRKLSLPTGLRVIYVAIIGILVGWQIYDPSKRFIEAVAGLIVIGVVWNFSALQGVWLILLTYAFPFALSVGNSTFIFTFIVFVIYMLRVSTGQYRFHGDKLLNLPIVVIVMAYIVSFYNQSSEPMVLNFAIFHTISFFVILILYYMLVNLVDSEENLRKTIGVLVVSLALVTFFSFIELLFPGRVILPNLIYSVHKVSVVMKDVRVMGPFRDYELLAQFFAANVPILILMAVRSRRLLVRFAYVLLLISVLFMQFATITRGAFVSLIIGIVYMAWICRRDLNILTLTGLAAAFVGMFVLIDLIMSRYTVSGSLFARLLATTIKSGFIPDTRVIAWSGGVDRWLLHPFIGNGPGWDFSYNIEGRVWPHSSYIYYLNIFGIFGTAGFLLLLYRLVRASMKEMGQSLVNSSFPRALMKVLHVSLIILIVDMAKVDYQRNIIYMCFVWILFALISASRGIIDRSAALSRADTGAGHPKVT